MKTESPSTEARLARLERSIHSWRLAAVGLAGLLLIAMWSRTGASAAPDDGPVQDLVRTKKLLLVDDQNRTVASLSSGKNQITGLNCFDAETGTRVSGFGIGTDGSGVYLIATKKGQTVVIHSGVVNDQGVPLEKVQQAMEQLQHVNQP